MRIEDGMILVPTGSYFRGGGSEDFENPGHSVKLTTFLMDRFLVTNRQFREFCEDSGYSPQGAWKLALHWKLDNHPVTNITWDDASNFASWYGKELPTEAQWECAARAPDGRIFPWGNRWKRSNCCCALSGARGTAPVGSHGSDQSVFGCFDLAGNVSEWMKDYASINPYDVQDATDPIVQKVSQMRAVRGGNWFSNEIADLKLVSRGSANPNFAFPTVGFRCVRIRDSSGSRQ